MSSKQFFIKAITDNVLLSTWQQKDMAERIYWLLQSKPSWVKPLVSRIYTQFNNNHFTTTNRQLVDFISNDMQFALLWKQQWHQLKIRQFNLQQSPSAPVKLHCDIPQIQNIKALSQWLALSDNQLENYASNWRNCDLSTEPHHQHYHYHWIKKNSGKKRLIEAPKPRIASAQRQIYLGILNLIPLHSACHGFRKQHSCKSYVQPHSGKTVVIHMDLKNFFTSITLRRIHALFTTIGYHESVAKRLAGLCCSQTPMNIMQHNEQLTWHQRKQLMVPHLPQGSPSSPALANLCAYKLDLRLDALAKKLGGSYTRYADDLAFSGNTDFSRHVKQFPTLVAHIAITEGFSINYRKTRIMHQGVSQRLTGMVLNVFPNYPRKDYDRLKAILYNCIKSGHPSQNRNNLPHFKSHLQGKIAYVRSLNPEKAKKLSALFEQITW